ncbi:MAG: hypothetical protein NWF00_09675 [Candidatus Bathyarchaeota archaeon]|nr:hypothetical protein [Candidatus Bathyarchaeota archaeon]
MQYANLTIYSPPKCIRQQLFTPHYTERGFLLDGDGTKNQPDQSLTLAAPVTNPPLMGVDNRKNME